MFHRHDGGLKMWQILSLRLFLEVFLPNKKNPQPKVDKEKANKFYKEQRNYSFSLIRNFRMQGPIVSANGFRMEPFSRKRRRSFEDESEDLHRRLKKWKQKKIGGKA